MTVTEPPSVATWLLKHLARENDALAGDLLEEYRRRRSVSWYWRQVLTAIALSRSRVGLLTVGVVALYWVAHYIPIPGVNTNALASLARAWHLSTLKYDMFTGSNLAPVTMFALGVMPYVTAAILVQVAASLFALARGSARLAPRRMWQYTWGVAILLCVVQAYGLALFLERQTHIIGGLPLVDNPGWLFRLTTVGTLTSGTAALMWLSDSISARGIGNGMFLMVVAGALVGLPGAVSLLSQPALADASTILTAVVQIVVGLGVAAVTSHFYRLATRSDISV